MILDVDAGLVALCDYARPSIWTVIYCSFWGWWRVFLDRFWAIWHRVFPPELWGPYGPWSRLRPLADRVAGVVRRLAGRVK